ncbi:MAG TPA: ATP synthase F1 subunit epsilon [Candidatus Faecousia intestinigallinarum]|nr:ATP synthase F1 subunit epsilon [Candidatus Faecousia intestinigallinarum]
MTSFPLKIVTPDGLAFDGQAEELLVRTTSGDMGILAGHTNCVAPLGMGLAMVLLEGKRRYAACIGGMVTVVSGSVTLVATTFEWAENIDVGRAEASAQRAQRILGSKDASAAELRLAEARLKRALVRKGAAGYR